MTLVRLHTLGQCVIETEKGRLLPSASVPFGLIIYLAMERGRNVPRTQLLDLFYPDASAKSGAHCLRQMLYNLRQMGVPIEAEGRHVRLPAESVVADHDRVFAIPGVDGAAAAAVAGGFLPGFAPALSEGFSEWLEQQRGWVHAQLRRRLLEVMDERRKHGQWPEAERLARACLVIDPLNEEATCVIAESMALAGSKLEAVRLLENYESEVGRTDGNLGLPVRVLRRRICERFSYSEGRAGPLPLIGRDQQMTQLHRELERAARGTMVACVIGGEPGVGKTRLAASFADAAVVVGWRVARVSCQPHDVRRPLGVFSDLVPIVMQLPGALGCSPEATELLTRLFRLEDSAVVELSGQLHDPETLSANVIRSISELFDAVTSEAPLMVVVDSAEWIDPVSRRVALDILSERKDRRLLFAVTTTDPECLDSRHVNVHPIQLTALSEENSLALFNHCASRESLIISDAYRSWCLGIAAGNPLFIQTIVAHYAATRMEYEVPRQLTALLQQRLTSLSSISRRSLEACAVLGNSCTIPALETMLQYPRFQLIDAFMELERSGFVSTDGLHVAICHPLLRETALSEMPSGTQRLMHRGAAIALTEALEETRSAALAWECAQHWSKSGEPGRAVEVVRSVANHLVGVGEATEAVELLSNALGEVEDDDTRLSLLGDLIIAADSAAQWTTCIQAATDRASLAPPSSGDREAAYFIIASEALWRLGKNIQDRVPALRALARDQSLLPVLRARAATPLLVHAGQSTDRSLADESLAICDDIELDDASEERVLLLRLFYHTTFGSDAEAIEAANAAVAFAQRPNTPPSVAARLRANAGNAFRALGRFSHAAKALLHAFTEAQRVRAIGSATTIAAQLCETCLDIGDIEQAEYWHTRVGSLMTEAGLTERNFFHELQRSVITAARGDYKAAKVFLSYAKSAPAGGQEGHRSFLDALEALYDTMERRHDLPPGRTHILRFAVQNVHPGQEVETVITAWLLARQGRRADAEDVLQELRGKTGGRPLTRLYGALREITNGDWPFDSSDSATTLASLGLEPMRVDATGAAAS